MKFIALVSGGKDSCFNILHCLNAGHELVAIANLHPKKDRPDEIDSWMFQTVGHQGIELFAQCAEVPLFRTDISENEEEVIAESADLFRRIRAEIEFEGVSVGAIASTYQQVRVDRACAELDLRSLAYLWQRDQRELLKEINRSGMDVRVIKVAGQGSNKDHLGKTLASMETESLDMNESFGLHPCGEGGEYETFVFDTPFFPKRRMIMNNAEIVHHSTDDVYYLNFTVSTELKPEKGQHTEIFVPPSSRGEFSEISCKLGAPQLLKSNLQKTSDKPLRPQKSPPTSHLEVQDITFSGDFHACLKQIDDFFSQKPCGLKLVFHVVVSLKSMAQFGEMNEEYSAVFAKAAPTINDGVAPSRACIEADISEDMQITAFYTEEIDRTAKGIHVQGLSYWAPASIGPYSQCRSMNGISYVAGQIGLIPSSLALESDIKQQAVSASQSATRVLDVIHEHANNWTPRLAIVWSTSSADLAMAQTIWHTYSKSTLSKQQRLPLIAVLVESLPRNAQIEWTIQGCDSRFFGWYIPENDDEDELYSEKPESSDISTYGYAHRAGFQNLVATTKPLEKYNLSFTTKEGVHTDGCPAKHVFYDGIEVEDLYIKI